MSPNVRLHNDCKIKTVSLSNHGHPTGVDYRFYRTNIQTDHNICVIIGMIKQQLLNNQNFKLKVCEFAESVSLPNVR